MVFHKSKTTDGSLHIMETTANTADDSSRPPCKQSVNSLGSTNSESSKKGTSSVPEKILAQSKSKHPENISCDLQEVYEQIQ